MIHMDLDAFSPPSRRQRFASVKRARSPDPFIFEDPPSKRVHFTALDIQRCLGDCSTESSRQSSEDWVQQARGLSIDGPLYSEYFLSEEAAKGERVENDEHMMSVSNHGRSRDFDKPQLALLESSGYPTLPPTQQVHNMDMSCSLDGPSTPYISANSVEDRSFQTPVKQNQRYIQQALPGINPIMGPSINVISGTSMEQLVAQECLNTGLMSASNSGTTPTNVAPSKLATPRKQRFMMGTRADCEKCRMGVKGHFVHLD